MSVASSFDAWYNVLMNQKLEPKMQSKSDLKAFESKAWQKEKYLQDGDPMGMLLFDYQVHEGHWDTANRVAEDILLGRVQVSQEVGSAASKLVQT